MSSDIEPIDHSQTARCVYHPEIEAESRCDNCEKPICGKDIAKSGTKEICYQCFAESAEDTKFGSEIIAISVIIPLIIGVFIALYVF